jgi:ribosomal protein S18 acetylase RimI-like enzyme
MDLTYFKRYRMEISLAGRDLTPGTTPSGYRIIPWDCSLLEAFAEAKYLSFRSELDVNVFPCLGELQGCRRLMNEIIRKPGFLPEATWLLAYFRPGRNRPEFCGTVQGVRDRTTGLGAIQNLGVAPFHRNRGLGAVLMRYALEGFRRAGLQRVFLEVTSQNEGAIRLYRRLGFVTVKTVYKAVEAIYS